MAHNRDPRKSYRTNRRGRRITSSSDRSRRSKKSTVPKPTSSSTRASTKGASSRVTTGQGGRRTNSPRRVSTGLIGTTNQPGTKQTYVGPPGTGKPARFNPANRRPVSKVVPTKQGMKGGGQLRGLGTAVLAGALATGSLRNPVSAAKKKEAKQSIGKYNTRDKDGKVRNRLKVGAKKVGGKIVGPKRVGTEAQSFDRAFAKAKKEGKKTFEWNGKTYNTKVK